MNQILGEIYIGDLRDAKEHPDMFKLCLLESPSKLPKSFWIKLLDSDEKARTGTLDQARMIIDAFYGSGEKLLVHCGAGIERSPLAVAYWLCFQDGFKGHIEEAYQFIQKVRPEVQYRGLWWVRETKVIDAEPSEKP